MGYQNLQSLTEDHRTGKRGDMKEENGYNGEWERHTEKTQKMKDDKRKKSF